VSTQNRRGLSQRIARAALVGTGVLALLLTLSILLFPWLGRWVVTTRVLPRVEARLGIRIATDAIDVERGRVVLYGIRVQGSQGGAPLATIARATAGFDFWPLLWGSLRLGPMELDKPHVRGERQVFHDLLSRLGGQRGDAGPKSGAPRRPSRLVVREGSLELTDREADVALSIEHLGATVELVGRRQLDATLAGLTAKGPASVRASAQRIEVKVDLDDWAHTGRIDVMGARVTPWARFSLSGISGSIATDAKDARARIDLQGGYGGVDGTLWSADGWIDPLGAAGHVRLSAASFTLDKLLPILKDTPVVAPEKTSLDASLEIDLEGPTVSFSGALHLLGLTLFHPWLADTPVVDLGFTGRVQGHFDGPTRRFSLDALGVDFRGVEVRLDGHAALRGGVLDDGTARTAPHVRAHLVVPEVPCQAALSALPKEITPKLQGFELKGTFSTDVVLDVDWADLDALVLAGSVGIRNCKVTKAPEEVAAERLLLEFEHRVEMEQDQWLAFLVGPSNPDYVPLTEVSPHVLGSFMTTEDSGFFNHHGFIVREFRSALIRDLKEGYFKYGASSITMQMVKNVLLYREKTLARKLQELFLTWYLESTLTKERILEIYVNVIEFGPGIYGIGPAARHYFGKHPKDLNPVEAAFFSSILPSPKARYLQYCEGQLSRWGDAKVQRILKVMRERERLTEAEYEQALQTPLTFSRTEALPEDECKAMTRKMIELARPTHPGAEKVRKKR
jgi:hypothetical protein